MMPADFSPRLPMGGFPVAILLLCILVLCACAGPPVILERILVRNATPGAISDVEIRHEPTLRFGAVSAILPGSAYELAFARAPMLAQQGVVSWRDDTGRQWSKTLPLPDRNAVQLKERVYTLVYLIEPAGLATVSLEP